MKSLETKLLQIGNARGIRLPAAMIRKHQLDGGVILEERDGEIVLRPKQSAKKLSWEETAQQMAAASEDWSDWEAVPDGWNGEQRDHDDRLRVGGRTPSRQFPRRSHL